MNPINSQPEISKFWCFICESTINISDLSSFNYHCPICNSESIELITESQNPLAFQPPVRTPESLLTSHHCSTLRSSTTNVPTAKPVQRSFSV